MLEGIGMVASCGRFEVPLRLRIVEAPRELPRERGLCRRLYLVELRPVGSPPAPPIKNDPCVGDNVLSSNERYDTSDRSIVPTESEGSTPKLPLREDEAPNAAPGTRSQVAVMTKSSRLEGDRGDDHSARGGFESGDRTSFRPIPFGSVGVEDNGCVLGVVSSFSGVSWRTACSLLLRPVMTLYASHRRSRHALEITMIMVIPKTLAARLNLQLSTSSE